MKKILALDLATTSGWAFGTKDKINTITAHGVYVVPKTPYEGEGIFYRHFRNWFLLSLTVFKPDLIAFESIFHRGKGTVKLMGLSTIVKEEAEVNGIHWVEIHNATLKKHATGSGRGDKKEMMEKAKERGWKFVDDNEADALWLLDYIFETIETNE